MDSFFSKGFKASKCKTMLKLTIPRIKLLRNRREIQIKQMRKDIAKLLETGQEATARIRVEHIIREEKMIAAQEIVELFSELIAVRLPIIEAQKECPLDLKEAISSICFAAPRCADLPELQQVQLLFIGKYGKEFVAAASELRPECGVNRQLIELLSIRAPSPDVKLKVLKEIAEEHQLDWDASASETELLKPHEDLLNGPAQFVDSSKHEIPSYLAPEPDSDDVADTDDVADSLDFPEVPKQPIKMNIGSGVATEMLPFPASALLDDDFESGKHSTMEENESSFTVEKSEEEKQFLPFILPPPQSGVSLENNYRVPVKIETLLPESLNSSSLKAKREVNIDLQDVLAAAQAAAESAERAAAAARSVASLAQIRISELSNRKNESESKPSSENPFHVETDTWELVDKPDVLRPSSPHHKIDNENHHHASDIPSYNDADVAYKSSDIPSYDDADVAYKSSVSSSQHMHDKERDAAHHVFDRSPSMDDDPYSYPSLFTGSHFDSRSNSFTEDHTSKSGQ